MYTHRKQISKAKGFVEKLKGRHQPPPPPPYLTDDPANCMLRMARDEKDIDRQAPKPEILCTVVEICR